MNSSTSNSPAPDDGSIARALSDELERAQANHDRLAADYASFLVDPGVIQEDRDSAAQLVMQASGAVARAEAAVARMQAGVYGRCARCGVEIPAERLAALQDAEYCVACS